MSILTVIREPLATEVVISESALRIVLADGREISAPLAWFPRLAQATPAERNEWRLIGGGISVHWPAVDEDISIDGLLSAR